MFKKFLCFVFVFVLQVYSGCIYAKAPTVSGQAAVVIEQDSGKIIYEKNAHLQLPMASTTKIMTAICTIENINTNIPVTVSSKAVGVEGSSVYLKKGEVITVKELLYGMMLNSGNDAAVALAIAVSGSIEEFCSLMNETAENIGAKNTNFTNPSGLYEENHYTTAYDLALISAYALKNPLFQKIVSTKETKISMGSDASRYLKNHNKLLWMYDGCTGVKTGYTKKCGRCLVSSARKDAVTLVSVTLSAPNDWDDHKKMLDYGFSSLTKSVIATKGEFAATLNSNGINLPLHFDKKVEIPAVQPDEIKVSYKLNHNIQLPVYSGHTLGRAVFKYNGKVIASADLVTKNDISYMPDKNFMQVFIYGIKGFIL